MFLVNSNFIEWTSKKESIVFIDEPDLHFHARGPKISLCDMELPEEVHLKVHEDVHKHAKSRIIEYGDPEFSKDNLR
jgi:hypothetical protein